MFMVRAMMAVVLMTKTSAYVKHILPKVCTEVLVCCCSSHGFVSTVLSISDLLICQGMSKLTHDGNKRMRDVVECSTDSSC